MVKENKLAARVIRAVHIIFTIGFKAGSEAIKTQLPFLRLPVIGWLYDFIVGKFGGIIDDELKNHATFVILDIQTAIELRDFEAAKENLKKAKESGNQDAINKSKEEFKKRIGDLVRWDGII